MAASWAATYYDGWVLYAMDISKRRGGCTEFWHFLHGTVTDTMAMRQWRGKGMEYTE